MQISYKDKTTLQSNPSIPDENKVTAKDMNEIKAAVNANEQEQQALILTVETNTQDIGNIKEEQTTQNNDIQENKANINKLEEEKATRKEIPTDLSQLSNDNTKFVNQTELLNAIENEKTQRQNADNNLQSQIETNKTNIQTNATNIAANTQDINNIKSEQTTQNAKIQTNTDNITALTDRVSTAEGDIGEIKEEQITQNSRISTLETDNETNKEDISDIKDEQEVQNTAISNNTEAIEKLQAKNAELEQENEDLRDNQIFGQATGTEIYLSDSAKAKNRSIGLTGRTTQESTTGKQLFDWSKITNISRDVSNATLNETLENGVVVKGNTSSAEDSGVNSKGWFKPGESNTNARINITEVSNITISADITLLESGGVANEIRFYLGNGSATKTSSSKSLTLNQKIRLSQIYNNVDVGNWFPIFTLASNKIKIENIMVSTSSDISYEPYTGGQAAPSPIYPFEIKNTGDSGSINEKVQSKNFLPTDNIDKSQAGVKIVTQKGGSLLFNGTKNGAGIFNFDNNIFELQPGDYTLCSRKKSGSATGTVYHRLFNVNKNTEEFSKEVYQPYIFTNWRSYGLLNFTVTEKSKYYFRMIIPDRIVFDNFDLEIIIYKGTLSAETIGDFVKHEAPQTLSFPLAQGQKLMEGDYLADDGVHHVRGEYALTGDEYWIEYQAYHNGGGEGRCYYIVINTDNPFNNCKLAYKTSICSHFANFSLAFSPDTGRIGRYSDHTTVRTKYFVTDKETVAEWKAWLAEQYANGTPVIVQYELAEEQKEDFTEEQKEAWEQIKKLRTYKGGTTLSSEDETPATVDITYVRDTATVIDNLETRIEKLESEV